MNKPLALLSLIAVSLPLLGCVDNPPRRGDTVFHQTDQNPRAGSNTRANTRANRYGLGGTQSPSERAQSRDNRLPTDPDGIVKPRDSEPGSGADPRITSTNPPQENPTTPGVPKEETTPGPAAAGEVPYAEAVPGKYGLVYSPFVKDKKNALVNVTDVNNVPLPPGTEVTCPHTQKIFRVP